MFSVSKVWFGAHLLLSVREEGGLHVQKSLTGVYVPPVPTSTPKCSSQWLCLRGHRGKSVASLSTGRASFSIHPALEPTISSLSSFYLKGKTAKMHELPQSASPTLSTGARQEAPRFCLRLCPNGRLGNVPRQF